MEFWLWMAVTLLLCAAAALAMKVLLMRAAARALARVFAQRLETDTNTLLDLPCRDGAMRELADSLNAQLRQLRDLRRRFQRGDLELKEAVTNLSHDLRTPSPPSAAIWSCCAGRTPLPRSGGTSPRWRDGWRP